MRYKFIKFHNLVLSYIGIFTGYFSLNKVDTMYLVNVVAVKKDMIVPRIVVIANPLTGPVPK